MIDEDITHHIQKYSLAVLSRQRVARFKDLKKPGIDTNLFTYHLKLLVQRGFVKKGAVGYTLDTKGLLYADRVSESNGTVRVQPKIVSMLLVQDLDGNVLLWQRDKQPYIDAWTLPHGKVHIDDETIETAAQREASEKLGLSNVPLRHVGDCYVRVSAESAVLSATLMHVFRCTVTMPLAPDRCRWVQPRALENYAFAPAAERIIARSFFDDTFFFEEFQEEWRQ